MMIPGSNLLKTALTVIASQAVTYFNNTGRANNAIGNYVPSFAPGVTVKGSFQPVPRNKYENMGLDFQRDYFTFYASRNVLDLSRDVAGDQLEFQGKRFQCVSKVDWYGIDGWDGVLCVKIEPTVGA